MKTPDLRCPICRRLQADPSPCEECRPALEKLKEHAEELREANPGKEIVVHGPAIYSIHEGKGYAVISLGGIPGGWFLVQTMFQGKTMLPVLEMSNTEASI